MNIWVADAGATCHMGCILVGMTDKRPSKTNIKVGNRQKMNGAVKGDINVLYDGLNDGMKYQIRLTKYMHASKLQYNLYSIPYAVKLGASVRMVESIRNCKGSIPCPNPLI